MANAPRRPPRPFLRHVDENVDFVPQDGTTSSHLTMTGLLVLEVSQRCLPVPNNRVFRQHRAFGRQQVRNAAGRPAAINHDTNTG